MHEYEALQWKIRKSLSMLIAGNADNEMEFQSDSANGRQQSRTFRFVLGR